MGQTLQISTLKLEWSLCHFLIPFKVALNQISILCQVIHCVSSSCIYVWFHSNNFLWSCGSRNDYFHNYINSHYATSPQRALAQPSWSCFISWSSFYQHHLSPDICFSCLRGWWYQQRSTTTGLATAHCHVPTYCLSCGLYCCICLSKSQVSQF